VSASAYEPDRPWVRQPWDTDLTWALFSQFLALPVPRRLQDLCRSSRLGWTQLETYSREGWWRERAAWWDDHLAQIHTSTIERVTEETAEQVARRQLTLIRDMQELAHLEIGALLKMARQANGFAGVIQPRDALRLAVSGVRLERLVRGEDPEEVQIPDVSGLSLDELRSAAALQQKAGIR